jgi:hypothetical protein
MQQARRQAHCLREHRTRQPQRVVRHVDFKHVCAGRVTENVYRFVASTCASRGDVRPTFPRAAETPSSMVRPGTGGSSNRNRAVRREPSLGPDSCSAVSCVKDCSSRVWTTAGARGCTTAAR